MTVSQIIQNISIFAASCSVFYGINAWKREYRGKRQIELAENTLALFYEAIEAIKNIRCPMSFSSETDKIKRNEGEDDKQFEARKNAFVVFNRYEAYNELFSKIHALRYRFMAQIGKKQSAPFDELRDVINEILGSARRLSRLWAQQQFSNDKQRDRHFSKIEKYEAVFWDGYEDDIDPINPKVEKLLLDIEKTCQSIISGKKTRFNILNWKKN